MFLESLGLLSVIVMCAPEGSSFFDKEKSELLVLTSIRRIFARIVGLQVVTPHGSVNINRVPRNSVHHYTRTEFISQDSIQDFPRYLVSHSCCSNEDTYHETARPVVFLISACRRYKSKEDC